MVSDPQSRSSIRAVTTVPAGAGLPSIVTEPQQLRGEEGDGGCGADEGEEEKQNEEPSHPHHTPMAQSAPGPVM